jgi:hypothetical protein
MAEKRLESDMSIDFTNEGVHKSGGQHQIQPWDLDVPLFPCTMGRNEVPGIVADKGAS